MESVKTIKGIDEDIWLDFKSLAAKNNLKMPEMFKVVVRDWGKNSSKVWEEILNNEGILSDKEAKDILKTVNSLRKEKGYR